MKKGMWLMVGILSCIWVGCGTEKETTSQTASADMVESNGAYKEVIRKYIDEGYTDIGVSFIKIDDDDNYEMAVILGEAESDGAYLYTCQEGVPVQLKTDTEEYFGRNGGFVYYPEKNSFESEYERMGMDDITYHLQYFSMDAGTVIEKDEVEVVSIFDTDDETYYANGVEITKEEYDAMIEKYNGLGNAEIIEYAKCKHVNDENEI